MQTDDRLARCLLYLTYVTGARISEAVDFTRGDLILKEKLYRIEMRVAKKRGSAPSFRLVPIPRGSWSKCQEDAMMEEVTKYINNFDIFQKPFRKWGREEGKGGYMKIYLRRAFPEVRIMAKIKNEKGIWYDGILQKPLHAHYLRHCRATHLVDYYGFSDAQLRAFFTWEKPEMAARYARFVDVERAFSP